MQVLASAYSDRVNKTLRIVCSIQIVIAVAVAVGFYSLGLKFSGRLGPFAILLATLSPPSLAATGVWYLRRYDKTGWKRSNPIFDFDGRWAMRCTFTKNATSMETSVPAPQVGHMEIAQSATRIDLTECRFTDEITDKEVSTLRWLSCSISEAGDMHTIYEINETLDGGVIRGYERIWVTRRNVAGRPLRMKSTWYDCVRDSGHGDTYVGESEYWRHTSEEIKSEELLHKSPQTPK